MRYLWKETDLKWNVLGLAIVAAIAYPAAFILERKFGL